MNATNNKMPPVYSELDKKLYSLINTNPDKAIEKVKSLKSKGELTNEMVNMLKGSIFIDAGNIIHDPDIIEEGVKIFWDLFHNDTRRLDHAYNLANGLTAFTKIYDNNEKQWFIQTHEWRKKARWLYNYVASFKYDNRIRTQAMTNIGNLFLKSQRILEAYDAYKNSLYYDPENLIAATGAAKILLHYIEYEFGNSDILTNVAANLIKQANNHRDKILKYGSSHILDQLESLLSLNLKPRKIPKQGRLTGYELFVAKNRLALSPTIEGFDKSIEKWDSLIINFIIEERNDKFGVPPIFAMFNTLKSEYLTARLLTYQALNTKLSDSGFYSDTLDYANYGIDTSLLTLAQRSCIDILDKIAIATSEYFKLSGKKRSINFYKRWYIKDEENKIVDWADQIKAEIDGGNYALIALSELSDDLCKDGFLKIKKSLRDTSTHRFVVLHDESIGSIRKSKYIEHYDQDDFNKELITTLQVVRAALFYFVEMIAINEYKKKNETNSLHVPLTVPSHHWIRGDDKIDLE